MAVAAAGYATAPKKGGKENPCDGSAKKGSPPGCLDALSTVRWNRFSGPAMVAVHTETTFCGNNFVETLTDMGGGGGGPCGFL